MPSTTWLIAYLVGSIPFGYLVARARGVDIFAQGSGNVGATNVGRVLGRWFGILVFALDFAKGAGPVVAARCLLPADAEGLWSRGLLEVGAGMAAFVGHLFPIYLRFRGGKGVATGAGVVAVLFPLPALTAFLTWLGVVAATRYISLASSLAAVALVAMHLGPNGVDLTDPRTVFALVAGLLVVVKHRGNWRRLRDGTESRLGERPLFDSFARGSHVLALSLWCGATVFFTWGLSALAGAGAAAMMATWARCVQVRDGLAGVGAVLDEHRSKAVHGVPTSPDRP